VVSPQARGEQIAFACERGLSRRRACGLLSKLRWDCYSEQVYRDR